MKTLQISALALITLLFPAISGTAASFREAKVSEVVNKVDLLRPPSQVDRARIGAQVAGSTAVKTGVKSRTELTFPDASILRLGSNTQFSFMGRERDFNLIRGTAVLKTTKSSGGARIHSGTVTAAITGSMGGVAGPPPGEAGIFKLLLYYGDAHIKSDGKKYDLDPGQMGYVYLDKFGKPTGPVTIVDFDVALAAKTSNLVDANDPVLRAKIAEQEALMAKKKVSLVPSQRSETAKNLPGDGGPSQGSRNVFDKIASMFNPMGGGGGGGGSGPTTPSGPETPSMPNCPPGQGYDSDFMECFPVRCPKGTTFDQNTNMCVEGPGMVNGMSDHQGQ